MSTHVAEAGVEEVAHRHRWTRAAYERMVDSGGFRPEDKVELLDGELWDVSPQGSRHSGVWGLLMRALTRAFGDDFFVRGQLPIALDDVSEPEPDIAVVRGTPRDHMDEQPSEALLLVEISETSLSFDRGRKLAAYARNGVPEYWIVDLKAEKLHVFREPAGTRYASESTLGHGDAVTPLHASGATIAVDDLLP